MQMEKSGEIDVRHVEGWCIGFGGLQGLKSKSSLRLPKCGLNSKTACTTYCPVFVILDLSSLMKMKQSLRF